MRRITGVAARIYQAGQDRAVAVAAGAASEFDALETEFNGASIPLHLLLGFKHTPAYSCEFHTGGEQGRMLRAMAKQ